MDDAVKIKLPVKCMRCDGQQRRFVADWYTKDGQHHVRAVVISDEALTGLYIVKSSMIFTRMKMPSQTRGIVWLRSCGACDLKVPEDYDRAADKRFNEVPAEYIKGYWDVLTSAPVID